MSQTVAASPETTSGRRRIPYKWSVLTNTTLGMLMATINASIFRGGIYIHDDNA